MESLSKSDTIKSLQECIEDRKIKIYNYECEQIDTNTYLIHYITKSYDKFIYRTSIWIMKYNLKLLFHKASMLNEELECVKQIPIEKIISIAFDDPPEELQNVIFNILIEIIKYCQNSKNEKLLLPTLEIIDPYL